MMLWWKSHSIRKIDMEFIYYSDSDCFLSFYILLTKNESPTWPYWAYYLCKGHLEVLEFIPWYHYRFRTSYLAHPMAIWTHLTKSACWFCISYKPRSDKRLIELTWRSEIRDFSFTGPFSRPYWTHLLNNSNHGVEVGKKSLYNPSKRTWKEQNTGLEINLITVWLVENGEVSGQPVSQLKVLPMLQFTCHTQHLVGNGEMTFQLHQNYQPFVR